jgi:hypothetical protein
MKKKRKRENIPGRVIDVKTTLTVTKKTAIKYIKIDKSLFWAHTKPPNRDASCSVVNYSLPLGTQKHRFILF